MNRTLKTRWYHCKHEKEIVDLVETLKDGDLLEFQRIGYSHWALYVTVQEDDGNEYPAVFHRCIPVDATRGALVKFSVSGSMNNKVTSIGAINLVKLTTVIKNEIVRINNELDKEWLPFESQEIVLRAKNEMNKSNPEKYNALTNNCEHFVNKCRYGRSDSSQVRKMVVDAVVSTAGGLGWVARGALALTAVTVSTPVTVAVVVGSGILSAVPWIIRAGKLIYNQMPSSEVSTRSRTQAVK